MPVAWSDGNVTYEAAGTTPVVCGRGGLKEISKPKYMSKTVQQPDEATLRKAYAKADDNGKKLLADLWPEVFTRSPLEWVDTTEKLCEAAGVDIANYEIKNSMTYKQKADKLMELLMLLEVVFNEGKPINRADTSQRKWYPYFNVIPDESVSGGFRLAFFVSGYDFALAYLGARPEFVEEKISTCVGKKFRHIYEAWAQNFQLSKSNP